MYKEWLTFDLERRDYYSASPRNASTQAGIEKMMWLLSSKEWDHVSQNGYSTWRPKNQPLSS